MALTPITLAGRHARLEPLGENHLTSLLRHGAEAEVWRWMPTLRADPRESVRAWFERAMAGAARGDVVAWAIVDVARGEAVGGTTYLDLALTDKRVEIGSTWHGRAFWRTGINTECKFLLLRHAFETLGCNRVQLKTDARNERSQAAIARLGAVREGVLRSQMVMPDGWVRDTVMFSIIAAEWPAVKARLEEWMARPG
ncbi:MAG: N-acetyltransferase [Opitutus sp.]|nr:N-acetyltransferase [Opitutus sp.]